MSRSKAAIPSVTQKEFDSLGVLICSDDVAKIFGVTRRYVSDNAKDFGGKLVANKWVFSKRTIAEMFDIPFHAEETTSAS